MRTLLFSLLLLAVACRRPSRQLAATLTPTDKPTRVITKIATATPPNYGRYLKAGDEIVALGENPAWALAINTANNMLRFKSADGDSISVTLPQRQNGAAGSFRYEADASKPAGALTVVITPDSCVNTVTGQRADYRVEVNRRGRQYQGCGVALQKLALLQDIWVLTTFQNRPVTVGGPRNELPRLEIQLTEERVVGTTGCNRLSGPVRADSRRILFGPLVTTKMACAGDVGRFESDFLEALSLPLTYQVGDGKLTLLHEGKPVMTFKKVD